jgi:hypothetical protein
MEVSLEHAGATVLGEFLAQRRDGLEIGDKGW